MPGPPRKLDDDLIEAWHEAISLGLTPNLTCMRMGFSTTIWKTWKEQGETDIENGVDSLEARLVTRHARALGERSGNWLTMLQSEAQKGDAATVRWLLERCHQDVYALQRKVELTGKDGGAIAVSHTVDLSALTDADLEAAATLAKKVQNG